MDVVLFFIFSMAEYLSIFYLTLLLFSFNPARYGPQIVISSIALSITSFIMRSFGIAVLDVLLQIILFAISLRVMFKVNIFYAFVMSYGYVCVVVLQIIIISALHVTNLLNAMLEMQFGVYAIQLSTVLIASITANILRRFDFRYSFVPTRLRVQVSYRGRNLLLIALIVSEVLIVTLSYYFFQENFSQLHSLLAILLLILSGGALYELEKREYQQ